MPQCTSQKRAFLAPYGRGSMHSDLIDVTFKAHQRINKVNEGVNSRLKVIATVMDRHQEIEQTRITRTIGRVRQNLEKFKAYQKVLDKYKVTNLQTLQLGFNKRAAMTPRTEKRYKCETRLYYAGFSMSALQTDVDDMIERIQPRHRRGQEQQRLLTVAKRRSNYSIDRKLTNEAVRKERLAAILAEKKNNAKAEEPGKILTAPSSRKSVRWS